MHCYKVAVLQAIGNIALELPKYQSELHLFNLVSLILTLSIT
jgi:hypothetical protein